MSNVITYDIWILTFVCLSTDNFLLHLVCLWKLYYLQLFTINAYHLNANIMLFSYVICNYIWHMGSLYYELLFKPEEKISIFLFQGLRHFHCNKTHLRLFYHIRNKIGVINDPHSQTHSLASSGHYFLSIENCFVWTYRRTDATCENSDHQGNCGSAEWISLPVISWVLVTLGSSEHSIPMLESMQEVTDVLVAVFVHDATVTGLETIAPIADVNASLAKESSDAC